MYTATTEDKRCVLGSMRLSEKGTNIFPCSSHRLQPLIALQKPGARKIVLSLQQYD